MLAHPQYTFVCSFGHWTPDVAASAPTTPQRYVACLVCTVEPSIVFICQFHAPVCVCLCLLRNLRAVQARNSICAYMASCFRGGCALWIQTEGMRNNIATHNTILPSPITSSHLQTPPSTDGQHPLSKFHNVHADRQNPGFQSWLKIFM